MAEMSNVGGAGFAVTGSGDALACPACRLFYKIRNGIPVMLVEKQNPWTFAETEILDHKSDDPAMSIVQPAGA